MLCCGLFLAQPASAATVVPNFSPEILPEMELLAGVLTQTSWIEHRGPQSEGNEYYRALREFFSAYRGHEAVQVAQELTDLGFSYDAPVGFACHLGSLPELDLKYEYSSYLVERAHGRERLERFRLALRDLARESDFLAFYQSWQPSFQEWIAATELNGEMVVSWLEGFFGRQASEFHLLLAPAMFPGGGYGATIDAPGGELVCYQIIREPGRSAGEPEFPTGMELEYLSLHEWGHSFVNPALGVHQDDVRKLNFLYRPVANEMRQMAYTSVEIFMNEQVLRAVTTLAAEEIYGADVYESRLQNELRRSFYLTDEIIDILRDYHASRQTYPTFADFVPTLLERIADLSPASPAWLRALPWLLIPLSVLGIRLLLRQRHSASLTRSGEGPDQPQV